MAVAVAMGHGHGARTTAPAHKLEAPEPILKEKLSETYLFFQRKLRGTCWRLHGSVVTLTNHRACAQLFYAMADSRRVHDAQAPCLRTESSFWELIRLARLARHARGSGVINRRTEPPYHTRRGPG